jgi:phage shock protein PspC (stress-responsive transcriptional regulator)
MKAVFFLLMWGVATFIVYLIAAAIIQDKIQEIDQMTTVSSTILN